MDGDDAATCGGCDDRCTVAVGCAVGCPPERELALVSDNNRGDGVECDGVDDAGGDGEPGVCR
jgi:hypothetical protein